jgi:hypothetical protein
MLSLQVFFGFLGTKLGQFVSAAAGFFMVVLKKAFL